MSATVGSWGWTLTLAELHIVLLLAPAKCLNLAGDWPRPAHSTLYTVINRRNAVGRERRVRNWEVEGGVDVAHLVAHITNGGWTLA